jgi:hypothetical protein
LHKKVENLAFVVDRAPQPELLARDHLHHLIEMPCMDVYGPRPIATAGLIRIDLSGFVMRLDSGYML